MIDSEILDFYGHGTEEQRLARSLGRLDRVRTWEIMERHLPAAPAKVLDITSRARPAMFQRRTARRFDSSSTGFVTQPEPA